ncbi:MAG: hypothetical protein QOF89_5025 [Acidobacteriota bacterium]|jgi:hypothetical protein|nr:hypothetical protein [Acidobacteriota bacterium]
MKAAYWTIWGCLIIAALPLAAEDLSGTARQAATGDAAAVKALRAAGPAGMEALLKLASAEPTVAQAPAFAAALDAVCAQKDCAASHLYWYTDLGAASEAAGRSGKPILSLRLLGRLDEELSCANSRFFRTVLYANERISRELRDGFVLHWQSERPVPKVTIDFGDGRRLEGTVTGNSIHYILDSNGRLVDALPGLYGPAAFLRHLGVAADEARALAAVLDGAYPGRLAKYHQERIASQTLELKADLRRAGLEAPAAPGVWQGPGSPTAAAASRLASSKSSVEMPLLRVLLPDLGVAEMGNPKLTAIAELHAADARLDPASRRLLLAKGGAWVKGEGKEWPLVRFEEKIAEDTVRNEYLFHNQIHSWLSRVYEAPDLAAFDERVYDKLFLTPASDPWLGLGPSEVYSVLTPAGR